MLEVVKFVNGKYGIRNAASGVVLKDDHDRPRTYRSSKSALRAMNRFERMLERSFRGTTKPRKK